MHANQPDATLVTEGAPPQLRRLQVLLAGADANEPGSVAEFPTVAPTRLPVPPFLRRSEQERQEADLIS